MSLAPFPPREVLADIGDRLYSWRHRGDLAANDVLVWTEPAAKGKRIYIAFRGNPLKIERVYMHPMLRNYNYGIDVSIQNAFGFDAKPRFGRSMQATGVDGGLGQRLDDRESHYAQVLDDGVVKTVQAYLEEAFGGDADSYDVFATLMPEEGAPLQPFYSAKKKKWQPAGKEPPTVKVETREGRELGVDMCQLVGRLGDCGPDLVAAGRSGDFMVFHCTTPRIGAAESLKNCGGWLFPSLGVGNVPSVTFGPLALFASVSVILGSLKPYLKGRGVPPVTVYETDTWTVSGRGLGDAAKAFYDQLIGHFEEDIYGEYGAAGGEHKHQWILGAPLSNWVGVVGEVDVITSTKKLMSAIKARNKLWKPGMTDAQIEQMLLRIGESKGRYPYLEAKVNLVLAPECFRLAVTCASWEKDSKAFLKHLGFEGTLLVVADPPLKPDHLKNWIVDADAATLDYARRVYDAALAYSRENGLVRGFEE